MSDIGGRGGIKVRELLETPHLELELLAGKRGLDRAVSWTHVSELEQPEIWLDGGELLITNGLGMSSDAKGQAALISGLASKRAAGLALGVRGPALRKATIELADELDFPILRVPKPVPYLSIARLVADHNQDRAQRRLATHLRLFDTLRSGADSANAPELVANLESISGYQLFIVTAAGHSLLPGLKEPNHTVVEALNVYGEEPHRQSLSFPGGYAVPIPIASRTAGFLVALEKSDADQAGLGAVRHMGTIAALLISNLYRERELDRRRGAELLGRLLTGSVEPEEAPSLLQAVGLEFGPVTMVKLSGTAGAVDELHHRVCDLGIPHLMLSEGDDAYLALEEAHETLLGLLNDLDLVAGASSPHPPSTNWILLRLEASKTLERALADERPPGSVLRYSATGSPFEWLPSDPRVLQALSRDVLDPLREYDRDHNASLLESLQVYFDHERRLSEAAEALFVHKHTLAYRIKRIEEITGRKLSRMDDLCVLYLALKSSEASSEQGVPQTEAEVRGTRA